MIKSALNYTGGKYKLLSQILPLFPKKINTFIDLFCGGCNVGLNVDADKHIYNDVCEPIIRLYSVMKKKNINNFIDSINRIIKEYDLSDVKTNGYEYYKCKSSDGLSSYNHNKYIKLRDDFNSQTTYNDEYYLKLFVLMVFSFNNQIRFNKKGQFNTPIGKRDFNKRMVEKLIFFIKRIKEQNSTFTSLNFEDYKIDTISQDDFVYADPPYLITCASYNEQNGWNVEKEKMLLEYLDVLNSNNIKFALSNVLESKGKTNDILLKWIENRKKYRLIDLEYTYINANYQRNKKNSRTREIIIINY